MPSIIHTEYAREVTDLRNVSHDYDYPEGLDLDPKKKLHKDLVTEIIRRASASQNAMSSRYPTWNKIDRTLTAYIDLTDKEKNIQDDDDRKPVSIVYPNSFAILESLLSYLMAAFFRDPIFRYEGVGPEDTIGGILMELIVQQQCYRAKVPLNLHTSWRDGLSYGFGVVGANWEKEVGWKAVKKEGGFFSLMKNAFVGSGRYTREFEEGILYEGNVLNNIDPYFCLPDPDVSIHEAHKGEFFGWIDKSNIMEILNQDKYDDEYFNGLYVKAVKNKRTSIYGEKKDGRDSRLGFPMTEDTSVTSPVDILKMFVTLIPKEWKIGDSEYPEKWYFEIAADEIIIKMKPLGLLHDRIPIAVCAPDFDGYSSTPISRLEALSGLQGILDWLFNMHIANVRKSINDTIIYDPYLLNSNDLKRPSPEGKLVRLRKPAWGRGVKDVAQQLVVNDITRQHIADATHVTQAMYNVGVGSGQMTGMVRQSGPERLTGKEFQGSERGAISRLERIARIIGMQELQDVGIMFASNNQQLMTQDTYVKITGTWQEVLMKEYGKGVQRGRIPVSPLDLLINYDLFVRDGSIPGNQNVGTMMELFKVVSQSQELMQDFDMTRIFKHIAREAGAKNINDFVRIKVQPNEAVEQQVDKGNVVPMQQAINEGVV